MLSSFSWWMTSKRWVVGWYTLESPVDNGVETLWITGFFDWTHSYGSSASLPSSPDPIVRSLWITTSARHLHSQIHPKWNGNPVRLGKKKAARRPLLHNPQGGGIRCAVG